MHAEDKGGKTWVYRGQVCWRFDPDPRGSARAREIDCIGNTPKQYLKDTKLADTAYLRFAEHNCHTMSAKIKTIFGKLAFFSFLYDISKIIIFSYNFFYYFIALFCVLCLKKYIERNEE